MKNVSKIIQRVEKRTNGYTPKKSNLFNCFSNTPLEQVKVVIWTDKPNVLSRTYPNVYKELKNEYPDFETPSKDNLHMLSEQGVLFMCSAMCYSEEDLKAYDNVWFRFTNIVIQILNQHVDNCIHLLWGRNCQKLADNINSREIYTSNDPSSYMFFGNNHFIKTNITLKRQGKEQINWNMIS